MTLIGKLPSLKEANNSEVVLTWQVEIDMLNDGV